jgi:hypothetical protein
VNLTFRKLTLGVLYFAVALLVAVPPVVMMASITSCTDAPCAVASRQFFTADAALMWLLPFSIAAVLLALAFKLKNRR